MKNTKKLLSTVVCFVLLLSIVVTVIANADTPAELDKTKPYIEAVSEPVKAGEIAKVTYSLGNNPGIWGIRLEFNYDKKLSLVEGETNKYGTFPKYDIGQNFDHGLFSPLSSNELVYLYTNSTGNIVSNNKNGELFTLYFKVADDAAAGTYSIDLINYSSDDSIIDINNKGVEFTFGKAYVTVVGNGEEGSSSTTSSSSSSSSSSTGISSITSSSSSSSSSSASSSVSSSSSTSSTSSTVKTTAGTISTVATTTKVTITKLNSKPVVKLVKGKKRMTVKLKKAVNGATGYEVKYSTNKKLKRAKVKNLNSKKKSLVIRGLKSKKTYYVRVRAFSIVSGKKIYSNWSKTVKVKTK